MRIYIPILIHFVFLFALCSKGVAFDPFNQKILNRELSQAVTHEQRQIRKNLVYIPGSLEPYSGSSIKVYDNGQVESLLYFEQGRLVTVASWYENGQLLALADFDISEVKNLKIILSNLEEKLFLDYLSSAETKYLNGRCIGYDEDGQILVESNYSNGKLHGVQKYWYGNGQIQCEENYKNGKLNGVYRDWYYNGQLAVLAKSNLGQLVEIESFLPNGEPCELTNFSKGEGIVFRYDEDDGSISREITYLKGMIQFQKRYRSDGSPYEETSYVNGKKHGFKIRYWNNNEQIYYEDGQLANGLVSIFSEEKQHTETGQMIDGQRHGEWTFMNNQGIVLKHKNYELGNLEGNFTSYFPTGEIKAKGEYKGGLKDGDWILYNKDNAPVSKTTYKGDNKSYEIIYFENGEKKEEGDYVQGKKDGLWRIKNTAKKSFEVGKYQNGLRHGLWIEVMLNSIIAAKNFESGKLVKIIENDQLGEVFVYDEVSHLGVPRPIRQTVPTYPREAKNIGLEGKAIAEFVIDQRGYAKNIKVVEATDSIFIECTIEALKKWKFTPPSSRVEAFGEEYVIDFKSEVPYKICIPINYSL